MPNNGVSVFFTGFIFVKILVIHELKHASEDFVVPLIHIIKGRFLIVT